jgi:hypothetical protein
MEPVSWLQIEQGWRVVGADGGLVGTVAQVEGDKQADIFDGLAVAPSAGNVIRYVPGEQVGRIVPGEVNLRIAVPDAAALAAFTAPPPETAWVPGKAALTARIVARLRGRQGVEGISERPIGGGEAAPTRGRGSVGPGRPGSGRRPLTWRVWAIAVVVTVAVLLILTLR